jgi:hypothetical protein
MPSGPVTSAQAEGLAASPAKARHEQLLRRGRQFQAVIRRRVEVGGDLAGAQMADRLHQFVRLGAAYGDYVSKRGLPETHARRFDGR